MALSDAYKTLLDAIEKIEPRVYQTIHDELTDQRASLKLIASESYASLLVPMTMGTWLSDKYAEGITGHRFYTGCQDIGVVRSVAAKHVHELFDAEYVYIQPHSGIDANLTVYRVILVHHTETPVLTESGSRNISELSETDWETLRARFGSQRLLGMSLDVGGHLTRGFRPSISGKMFHQHSCDTNPTTGLLDYDALAIQIVEFKPLVIAADYSAYPCRIDFAKIRETVDSVSVVPMVDMAHSAGSVAGKMFMGNEDPVPSAQVVTVTTHKSLRGPRSGPVLAIKDYAGDVDRGRPAVLDGPLSHIMAAKAVALAETRTEAFWDYAHRVVDSAHVLAEGLLKCGGTLVAGGTDNHIVLLDASSFGLTGQQTESALLDSGVITNRNSVPNDPNGARYISGIRLGIPASTSRDFTTSGMGEVAAMATDVLKRTAPTTMKDGRPDKAKYELAQEVADGPKDRAVKLLGLHPLYSGLTLR